MITGQGNIVFANWPICMFHSGRVIRVPFKWTVYLLACFGARLSRLEGNPCRITAYLGAYKSLTLWFEGVSSFIAKGKIASTGIYKENSSLSFL